MPNEQQKIKSVAQFQNDEWGTPIPLGADAENIDITNTTENPSSDATNTSAGLIANDVTVTVGDTDATAWTKFNRFRKRVQNSFGSLAGKTFTNNYEQSGTDNKIYSATVINNLAARDLPIGGANGDVLVKNGASDYVARWTNTPLQMGSLATIETSPTSQAHAQFENIIYNGKLYQVVIAVGPNESLVPGTNIIERKAIPEIFTYTSDAKTVSPGGETPTWFFYNEQFPAKGNYLIIGYVWSDLSANVMFQCRLFTDNLIGNYIKNDPVMYKGVTVQSVGFGTTNFSLGTFVNDVTTITGQPFSTSITARAKAVVIKL